MIMEFDLLKKTVNEGFAKLEPIVTDAMNQLFMQTFKANMEISPIENLISLVPNESFPSVMLQFVSDGVWKMKHLFIIQPPTGLNLYAAMIGDEPQSEIDASHLGGLQEGANQIVGQVQVSFQSEGLDIQISNLKVELLPSPESLLNAMNEEPGIHPVFAVDSDFGRFSIGHYLWRVGEGHLYDKGLAGAGGDSYDNADAVKIAPADFQNFSSRGSGPAEKSEGLDMLMDVELEVIAELGKKTILIKDLLKLGTGSVVELNKAAGEPLDLLVNGRKFGEGEVVVIDDHFGIRITQLMGKKDKV
jgi:flagellar motor switch protein FliN